MYEYGNYFAEHALYSHWWYTRYWNPDPERTEHQLILARVLTGKVKDYGRKWKSENTHKLKKAPSGFDSVSGTESDQQVPPVQVLAGRDTMAKELVDNGHRYGRQYVVFDNKQSYPAYVVTYTVPDAYRAPAADEKKELKWEHRAAKEKAWTEYPAEHCKILTEALRENREEVQLTKAGKIWRVNLKERKQYPVRVIFKWRHVRWE